MDHRDVLLAGGEEGYALSWMDARVGDWVVTPRRGKPIEINALWYNALRLTGDWCERALRPAGPYPRMGAQAPESAQAGFWDCEGGLLYFVLESGGGGEARLRPHPGMAPAPLYSPVAGAPPA